MAQAVEDAFTSLKAGAESYKREQEATASAAEEADEGETEDTPPPDPAPSSNSRDEDEPKADDGEALPSVHLYNCTTVQLCN